MMEVWPMKQLFYLSLMYLDHLSRCAENQDENLINFCHIHDHWSLIVVAVNTASDNYFLVFTGGRALSRCGPRGILSKRFFQTKYEYYPFPFAFILVPFNNLVFYWAWYPPFCFYLPCFTFTWPNTWYCDFRAGRVCLSRPQLSPLSLNTILKRK